MILCYIYISTAVLYSGAIMECNFTYSMSNQGAWNTRSCHVDPRFFPVKFKLGHGETMVGK